MEDCGYFSNLISLSLDGQLTPEQASALETHLSQCPQCRELAKQLAQIRVELDTWEDSEVPEGFTQEVMDRIRALEHEKKVLPLWKRPQVRAGASLAACALLCVGLWSSGLLSSGQSGYSTASVSESIAADDQSAADVPALEKSREAPQAALSAAPPPASSTPDTAAPAAVEDSKSPSQPEAPEPAGAEQPAVSTAQQAPDLFAQAAQPEECGAPVPQAFSLEPSAPDSGALLSSVTEALGTEPGTLMVLSELPQELEDADGWDSTQDGYAFLVLDLPSSDGLCQQLAASALACLEQGDGPFVVLIWN